jgi:hypothetical protein
MAEIDRLDGDSDWIDGEFVEREETPRRLMRYGIEVCPAGLSLAETTSVPERFGIDRCRTTVHDWVRTADLQPANGARSGHAGRPVSNDTCGSFEEPLVVTQGMVPSEVPLARAATADSKHRRESPFRRRPQCIRGRSGRRRSPGTRVSLPGQRGGRPRVLRVPAGPFADTPVRAVSRTHPNPRNRGDVPRRAVADGLRSRSRSAESMTGPGSANRIVPERSFGAAAAIEAWRRRVRPRECGSVPETVRPTDCGAFGSNGSPGWQCPDPAETGTPPGRTVRRG